MRRRLASVALALTAGLVLTGCGIVDGVRDLINPRPTAAAPAETPPEGAPTGLEKFYAQELTWEKCSGGECATLTVPMDYEKPDGQTLEIAVLRVRATSRDVRGSIIVNPGGPGGSGVDYARAARFGGVVSQAVLAKYDVVGFDPRGVGRSTAIKCLSPTQLDAFFAQDPTPDTPAEEQTAARLAKEFGASCETNSPGLADHVSTVESARDMDILRSRLGDPRLNYLGKSYGTLLGATYAGLYPNLVGRTMLDGALPPDLTSAQVNLGQAEGFERAARAWAADCVQEGCPLGADVDSVMSGLRGFLAELDQHPITKTGDPSVPAVTEGWAGYAVAAAMYDEGRWGMLTDALRKANAGDGADLLALANSYTDRLPGGGYSSNTQEAFYAVTCLDKGESPDLDARQAEAEKVTEVAPTFGALLVWSSLPCGYWPRPAWAPTGPPAKVTAAGSGPIVVIGTTRDPATPYEWAQQLADQLEKGVLVSYDGDGHTAYLRSNDCIDHAIDDWYIDGIVPKEGLMC